MFRFFNRFFGSSQFKKVLKLVRSVGFQDKSLALYSLLVPGTGTSPCGVVQSNKVKQIGRAQKVSDHFVFVREFISRCWRLLWGVGG